MAKRVLLTGGNKGIGLEATKMFVEAGYDVVVVARNFENFAYEGHKQVEKVVYDLNNVEGIKDLVAQIGHVDILVNNSGIMNSLPFDAYPEEDMKRLMNVNLYAPIELIKAVAPSMAEKGAGRIVTTASVAGQIGHPDIWYGVSKAGIINATKSFAKLLAPKGIMVNAVAPSPVKTDMLDVIPEARKEFMKNAVYSNRFAEPEEVAKVIYWLATDCPEYVNGVCIDVNNGAFPR